MRSFKSLKKFRLNSGGDAFTVVLDEEISKDEALALIDTMIEIDGNIHKCQGAEFIGRIGLLVVG